MLNLVKSTSNKEEHPLNIESIFVREGVLLLGKITFFNEEHPLKKDSYEVTLDQSKLDKSIDSIY